MRTIADDARGNLGKEMRAVEEGHRAFAVRGVKGVYRVVSDSVDGRGWLVAAGDDGVGRRLVATICEAEDADGDGWPPGGRGHGRLVRDDGVVCCKHAAVVLRRLEREGKAVMASDGLWEGRE
jgi:hypothetical protein